MTNICRIPFNDEPPSEQEAKEFDEDRAYDEWRQQRDENIAVMKPQNLIAKGKGENDG